MMFLIGDGVCNMIEIGPELGITRVVTIVIVWIHITAFFVYLVINCVNVLRGSLKHGRVFQS